MTYLLCKLLRRILHDRPYIQRIGHIHNGGFSFYRVFHPLQDAEPRVLDILCRLNNHLVTKLHWLR